MAKESHYTPGVCNINRAEIANRKKAGHVGVGLSVVILGALVLLHETPMFGLVMFFPLFLAAIGYLQAKSKFCVSYAASGLYSKSSAYADTAKVVNQASRKLDAARARAINTKAALVGAVGVIVSVALLAIV